MVGLEAAWMGSLVTPLGGGVPGMEQEVVSLKG